jgi:hypothetical protein
MNQAKRKLKPLILTRGAMALDGGSISLRAASGEATIELFLKWSIQAQCNHGGRLYVNGKAVKKRSPAEERWLARLRSAEIMPEKRGGTGERISSKRVALSQDIDDYLAAVDEGPTTAVDSLRKRLIRIVRSKRYAGE